MTELHSILGPSSLHRRMACPGSMKAEEPFWGQDNSNASADEGSMLHELAATCNSIEQALEKQPGLNLDQQKCLSSVLGIYSVYTDDPKCIVKFEEKVEFKHKNGVLYYGKADCIVLMPNDFRIILPDLKFGRNPVDQAKDNIQLAAYALAVKSMYPWAREIEVRIIQPRCGVMNDSYTYTDFEALEESIVGVIDACKDKNAARIAGDHCGYCRAKGACQEYNASVMEVAKVNVFQLPPVSQMSDDDLLEIKKRYGMLTTFIKEQVDTEIKNRIQKGNGPACGYRLQKGKETRECKDINEVFNEAIKNGINDEEFRALCDLSYSELIKLTSNKLRSLAAANGSKVTVKEAEQEAKSRYEGLFNITTTEPYLMKEAKK